MTREKEIDNAKNAFYKRILEDGYYYDPRDCFEEGADWADANPKSSWISVKDDLPCNNPNNIHFGFTNRVLATDGKNISIACMKKNKNNKWVWCNENSIELSHVTTHWMPIIKLPKE